MFLWKIHLNIYTILYLCTTTLIRLLYPSFTTYSYSLCYFLCIKLTNNYVSPHPDSEPPCSVFVILHHCIVYYVFLCSLYALFACIEDSFMLFFVPSAVWEFLSFFKDEIRSAFIFVC